jgi:ribonuclease R
MPILTDALRRILAAHGLSPEHSPAAEAEAAALVAAPGLDDPALVDLTALPLVTIDELTSKDLDQAVAVEAAGDGHVVWYALADASWYVQPGTALWDEAMQRGTSFYLPGLVAPMLPRSLSEGIVSINEGVDRRALVFRMNLDSGGNCTATRLIRARVHSHQKLAFSQVQSFLDGQQSPIVDPAIQASLRQLKVVGERRMVLADERHVIRFRRREIALSQSKDGLAFVALGDLRNHVEQYNEQISLLVNMEGAKFLHSGADLAHVHPIYRVHAPPGAERLDALKDQLDGLIRTRKLGPEWVWDPQRERLAAYLDRLPQDGAPGRIARAIHRQAMMTGGTAVFASAPGVHHGVGADFYARFSAPMREIVGIFLHEEAVERLVGHDLPHAAGVPDDATLREAVIVSSNRAHELQRLLDNEVNRLVLDQLFEAARIADKPLSATVMGINPAKVYVQLDDPPIDVKIYVPDLERRHGAAFAQRDGAALRRREDNKAIVKIGDAVQVRVIEHDKGRDRWVLDVTRA